MRQSRPLCEATHIRHIWAARSELRDRPYVPIWTGHFLDRPSITTPTQIATPIPTASQSGSEVAEYRATPTPTPSAVAAPYVVPLRRFFPSSGVSLLLSLAICSPTFNCSERRIYHHRRHSSRERISGILHAVAKPLTGCIGAVMCGIEGTRFPHQRPLVRDQCPESGRQIQNPGVWPHSSSNVALSVISPPAAIEITSGTGSSSATHPMADIVTTTITKEAMGIRRNHFTFCPS